MKPSGTITAGIAGAAVEIGYNNDQALDLARTLFDDLRLENGVDPSTRFDIIASGPKPMLSLWQGDKKYYYGRSRYQLAYILINEVLYHCIAPNRTHLAIHAGAVCTADKAVMLPGKSGSGKSTLTAGLIANGYFYLSDELVFLAPNGMITPFTRPLSFKADRVDLFNTETQQATPGMIADHHGAMVPHRLINPEYSMSKPCLTHIVFPRFISGAQTEITPLSAARSCQRLMESFANARNFEKLGVSLLSGLVRKCVSFEMSYGENLDLREAMSIILAG